MIYILNSDIFEAINKNVFAISIVYTFIFDTYIASRFLEKYSKTKLKPANILSYN